MRKHECGSYYNKYDAPLLKSRASFEFLFLVFFFVAFMLPVSAWATPQIIRVDGSVFDNAGVPVTASKDIEIKAYDAASGGSLLWTSSVYNTAVSTGKFTINLDAAAGSPSLVDRLGERTTGQAIYFQIEVDSGAANGSMDTPTIVLPRIRARGTTFALTAASADSLKGVTATTAEMNYLAGVSANVQSQINTVNGTASGVSAKVSKVGDSMSGALQVGANITSTGTVQAATLNSTAATASRFALFDSSKNLASSATTVTDTEFGYLSGVTASLATNLNGLTSNVQTQLNSKATSAALVAKAGDSMSGALQVGANITSTGTLTAVTINGTGLTASRALVTDGSKNMSSSAVTDTELGYLSGATANLQSQLGNKIAVAGGTMTGMLTLSSTPVNSLDAATKAYVDAAGGGVTYITDNTEASYTESVSAVTPAAATTDMFVKSGSASKTVYIQRIELTFVSAGDITRYGLYVYLLKRSTAGSSGTSTSATSVPMDSNFSAATSTAMKAYTANPTVGTLVGQINYAAITAGPAPGTYNNDVVSNEEPNIILFDASRDGGPIVLRGTSESVAVNFNGTIPPGTSPKLGCRIVYREK